MIAPRSERLQPGMFQDTINNLHFVCIYPKKGLQTCKSIIIYVCIFFPNNTNSVSYMYLIYYGTNCLTQLLEEFTFYLFNCACSV